MNHYGVLEKLLKETFGDKKAVGIEIGSGAGVATVTILNAVPNCFLYAIDSYEHRDGEEFEASHLQEYHDKSKEEAIRRLSYFENRVKLLAMKSIDAIKLVPKEIDFIWIDGDHSEKGITTDLSLYDPLVKTGGLIGGHDFGQVHPLTEIIFKMYDKKLNSGNDFTWWVFK